MDDKSLLLSSLRNFEGASLIDDLHLTCIDLKADPSVEDIEFFLADAQEYLGKELSFETATEIFTAISICFSLFPEKMLPIFSEYFEKSRLNANYIFINTSILFVLTHSKKQLENIPDYRPFVNDSINEILSQIKNNEISDITVFGHAIHPKLKNELIINLLLLSEPTKELISPFLPYILSQFLFTTDSKFKLLIENLSKTEFAQILPQTSKSNDEILEFITKDDRIQLISKMSEASLSLLLCSAILYQTKGQIEAKFLNKDNILPLIVIFMIYCDVNNKKNAFSLKNVAPLILEAVNLMNEESNLWKKSVDYILGNFSVTYSDSIQIMSKETLIQIIKILLSHGYKGQNMVFLNPFLHFFRERETCPFSMSDACQYIMSNISEAMKHKHRYSTNILVNDEDMNYFSEFLSNIKTCDELEKFSDFINFFCEAPYGQSLMKKICPVLINLIKSKIGDKKWDDVLLFSNYIKSQNLAEKLQEIKEEQIPEEVRAKIFDSKENESIEELLSSFLADPSPEKNDEMIEALFDKMTTDKEMLQSYLLCNVFKYGDIFYQLSDFENIFTEDYKKYGDDFIAATNKVFYYQNIRRIMLTRPDFKISSLPATEIGIKVINKLFESIEQNPVGNYQAFFCLKSIACSFPFLYAKYSQKIFDIVLPALDNYALIFNPEKTEEQFKLAKTAFSALSFLFSTLNSTVVFDDFIKWFPDQFETFSNSQVYAIIRLFLSIYQDKNAKKFFIAFVLKYNLINSINKLFDREIKEEYFKQIFESNLYDFINETYSIIPQINQINAIFIDLIIHDEHPMTTIFEDTLLRIPFAFEINNEHSLPFDCKMKEYIDNISRSRKFWINNTSRKNNNEDEIDEIMNDFHTKLEVHEPLPPGGDRPILYCTATVKMIKYLFGKPGFIINWCLNEIIIPVVLEMYQMICDSLNDLYEMNKNKNRDDSDDDEFLSFCVSDVTYPLYCQHDLIKRFFDTQRIKRSEYSLEKFVENEYGQMFIFEFISSYLTFIYNECDSSTFLQNIYYIVCILNKGKSCRGYYNNFLDMCGEKFIDICLSPICRNNDFIYNSIFDLLSCFTNLPNKAIYIVGFMILSENEDILWNGIKLLDVFDSNTQNIILSAILKSFDNVYEKSKSIDSIIKFISLCPSIIQERKFVILDVLRSTLNNISQEEFDSKIEYIGQIFTILAPKRGVSMSSIGIIQESKIPSEIKDTWPAFWEIYEQHHEKIMAKIEENTSLLESFSFLLSYPELVNFKTRSLYFSNKMKNRISRFESLYIRVNNNDLLSSSFRQLFGKSPSQLLRNFNVTFEDEGGDITEDAGGVTRQWFSKLALKLFDPNYGLFNITKKLNLMPSSNSYIHENHLNYFRFAGRFVARAIIEGICIDAHFTSSFIKQILHHEPKIRDLADVDDDVFKNLEYVLANDVDNLFMTFEVNREEFGKVISFPLKENGENIDVTNENKDEYVSLYVDFILRKEVEEQIKAFTSGFDSLISHDEIKIFTPNELDMIICGIDNFDVDDFIANTTFEHPYNENSPVIKMFFGLIRKWDNEKMAKLFFFMTGSLHLPPNGFKGFCEISGYKMKIQAGGEVDSLPQAHTCFNTIDLPPYETEELMNKKLMMAIYECDSIENY